MVYPAAENPVLNASDVTNSVGDDSDIEMVRTPDLSSAGEKLLRVLQRLQLLTLLG